MAVYYSEELKKILGELVIFKESIESIEHEKDYHFQVRLSDSKKSIIVSFIKLKEKRPVLLKKFPFSLSNFSDEYYMKNYSEKKIPDLKRSLRTLILSKIKEWR
jgi:hypothetical protein